MLFYVSGRPVQWRRALHRRDGGKYTDPKAREAMDAIAWRAKATRARVPGKEPCVLSVRVFLEPPKGNKWPVPIRRRDGDTDNFLKLVLDALNKVSYDDDCQIVGFVAAKGWAEFGAEPRTEISISRVDVSLWRAAFQLSLAHFLEHFIRFFTMVDNQREGR